MHSLSGTHSPDLVGSIMSFSNHTSLPYRHQGLTEPTGGVESLGIWFPGCPCSSQRASSPPFGHPHCSARNGLPEWAGLWLSHRLQGSGHSRQFQSPRSCHLRSQAQPSSGHSSLSSFLFRSWTPPHHEANLLFQSWQYKAFICLIFLNKGAYLPMRRHLMVLRCRPENRKKLFIFKEGQKDAENKVSVETL